MKKSGMHVILFRDINPGFWPHLGCSRRNTTIFSSQSIFRDANEELVIKETLLFLFLGSISTGLLSLVY